MHKNDIKESLVDVGLRDIAVDQMLEEHEKMQRRFQQGEYAEVAINVGRFCESVVHILQIELEQDMTSDVRSFAAGCLHSERAKGESTAIQQHIPNMLHTAYDIRNERDAVHVNLEEPVRRADARLGIALCSSMVVELIHEFVPEKEDIELNEVAAVIEDIATPVEENPLESLIESRFEFDRERVAKELDNIIVIVEEEQKVKLGPEFSNLAGARTQTISLLLGRLAAYDLGYIDQPGAKSQWFADHISYSADSVEDYLETDVVETDFTIGGHYIPGYHVDSALEYLPDKT